MKTGGRGIPCADSKAGTMSGNTSPSDTRKAPDAPASYQPQDRIQLQPGMPFIPYAGPGQTLYPQAFPAAPGRRKRQGRWHELGVLVALWLLVILVAAFVAIRFLDLSAEAGRSDEYSRAGAPPANHASLAALATSRMAAEDDPFDDPLLGLAPAAPASPAPAFTPVAPAPALPPVAPDPTFTPVAPAPAFTPVAPAPAVASLRASGAKSAAPRKPPVCPPALAAMQLCGATGK